MDPTEETVDINKIIREIELEKMKPPTLEQLERTYPIICKHKDTSKKREMILFRLMRYYPKLSRPWWRLRSKWENNSQEENLNQFKDIFKLHHRGFLPVYFFYKQKLVMAPQQRKNKKSDQQQERDPLYRKQLISVDEEDKELFRQCKWKGRRGGNGAINNERVLDCITKLVHVCKHYKTSNGFVDAFLLRRYMEILNDVENKKFTYMFERQFRDKYEKTILDHFKSYSNQSAIMLSFTQYHKIMTSKIEELQRRLERGEEGEEAGEWRGRRRRKEHDEGEVKGDSEIVKKLKEYREKNISLTKEYEALQDLYSISQSKNENLRDQVSTLKEKIKFVFSKEEKEAKEREEKLKREILELKSREGKLKLEILELKKRAKRFSEPSPSTPPIRDPSRGRSRGREDRRRTEYGDPGQKNGSSRKRGEKEYHYDMPFENYRKPNMSPTKPKESSRRQKSYSAGPKERTRFPRKVEKKEKEPPKSAPVKQRETYLHPNPLGGGFRDDWSGYHNKPTKEERRRINRNIIARKRKVNDYFPYQCSSDSDGEAGEGPMDDLNRPLGLEPVIRKEEKSEVEWNKWKKNQKEETKKKTQSSFKTASSSSSLRREGKMEKKGSKRMESSRLDLSEEDDFYEEPERRRSDGGGQRIFRNSGKEDISRRKRSARDPIEESEEDELLVDSDDSVDEQPRRDRRNRRVVVPKRKDDRTQTRRGNYEYSDDEEREYERGDDYRDHHKPSNDRLFEEEEEYHDARGDEPLQSRRSRRQRRRKSSPEELSATIEISNCNYVGQPNRRKPGNGKVHFEEIKRSRFEIQRRFMEFFSSHGSVQRIFFEGQDKGYVELENTKQAKIAMKNSKFTSTKNEYTRYWELRILSKVEERAASNKSADSGMVRKHRRDDITPTDRSIVFGVFKCCKDVQKRVREQLMQLFSECGTVQNIEFEYFRRGGYKEPVDTRVNIEFEHFHGVQNAFVQVHGRVIYPFYKGFRSQSRRVGGGGGGPENEKTGYPCSVEIYRPFEIPIKPTLVVNVMHFPSHVNDTYRTKAIMEYFEKYIQKKSVETCLPINDTEFKVTFTDVKYTRTALEKHDLKCITFPKSLDRYNEHPLDLYPIIREYGGVDFNRHTIVVENFPSGMTVASRILKVKETFGLYGIIVDITGPGGEGTGIGTEGIVKIIFLNEISAENAFKSKNNSQVVNRKIKVTLLSDSVQNQL